MIEIEKPQIECIETPGDDSYGKYVVEPLERGYGTTLGHQLAGLTAGGGEAQTVGHVVQPPLTPRLPVREDINDMPIEEHLIVELYSK